MAAPEYDIDGPYGPCGLDGLGGGVSIPVVAPSADDGSLDLHREENLGRKPPGSPELLGAKEVGGAQNRSTGSGDQNVDDLISRPHAGVHPELPASRQLLEVVELSTITPNPFEVHHAEALELEREPVSGLERIHGLAGVVEDRFEPAGLGFHDTSRV